MNEQPKIKGKIILVDDDQDNRMLMMELLGLQGYEVISFPNYYHVKPEPDITAYIFDYQMDTGLNGEEFVNLAVKYYHAIFRPQEQVIGVSGGDGWIESGLDLLAKLQKPVLTKDLQGPLELALEYQRTLPYLPSWLANQK